MPRENGDSSIHEGNWYVLLAGLPKPAAPLTLASGVTLVPLDSHLSVFDLAAAGAAGFREWAMIEALASACTCEIESARDSAVTPGYDTLNRVWLASGLLVLRGFSRHIAAACNSYSWSAIAGHQIRTKHLFAEQLRQEGVDAAVYKSKRDLPPFRGKILDFHRTLLVDSAARLGPVTDEDAVWVRAHFDIFNKLASESERFKFALEAAIDWRCSKEPRIAVGRLWSGIESVFAISSELVYRISLLTASLLEPRGPRRRDAFHEIKRLYGVRSKAVHGETVADDVLVHAMNESYSLLRRLLLCMIEKGRIFTDDDFEEALFG